ncbi:MAG: VWA domain-containing protein, partial [Candidatus Limnocylindrales bacterium]
MSAPVLMPFTFASPEVLLLGVLVIGLTLLLSVAARHHLSRGRRRASLAMRTLILSLLVFALAGLQLALPVDRLTTVFVVDLSDSVGAGGRSVGLAFVREALEERPGGDQAAVVAFGRDALVERLPAELEDIDRIASVPTRDATDVGSALRLASALFPDETQKRIVLVSDGNDTTGHGQAEAALSASRGIRIETYEVGLAGADEVILQRLHTPATARVGEEMEAEITVSSTVAQPATVRLFGDGRQVGVREVELAAGLTRVVFTVEATEAGFHTFRAVVEAGRDTFEQNDRADSHTVVKGDPRILVVAGDAAKAENLAAALEAENQDVTLTDPDQVPSSLTELAGYDSVVLVDVPAADLGQERMEALQMFVRDVGRGLVMIGGEGSYGAGGYRQTPLEEALPVDMEVRDRERQPDVALVVVIDRSGSMDACHCN